MDLRDACRARRVPPAGDDAELVDLMTLVLDGTLDAHSRADLKTIGEILADGTRALTAQNVPRIRAATDLGNVPMAAAFARAGWVNYERAISMTWA